MPDELDSPALADPASLTAEERRLQDARAGVPWRAWGPYLSERQWGTVREDYSDSEDAWSYLSHDQARSRAYRWGEDGIAGISDDKQRLCLALALWNERDPIVKERLFGLTNAEGNHGEDVKESYFYVDNLPTHSYQRYLYKYPQAEFPYNDLVAVNRARSRHEFEYELIDTGVFDDGRYFDVEVEHAKAGPEDIFCRMLDEERFLGPHGIRSVSRWHLEHPYTFDVAGTEHRVQYEPAESTSGMFGGNSNWRGPVWFPVNLLLIRALIQHYRYYGNDMRVECPTGSGKMMTLLEVAQELSRRLAGTFLRDGDGRRPVYGGTRLFQDDPHWRDLILFYEYFHGDNGAGLGASHQTGWTGLVARLIQSMGQFDADTVLEDRQWPMARPYRRLAAASMPDVATAREARGVTEPQSPP